MGMSVGILAMAFVVFARQIAAAVPPLARALKPLGNIAWPWYVLIGTVITLVIGILASFTHSAAAEHAA
jgi:hypothetical protein